MRELAAIDRDIAKASDRLRALRKERAEWLWIWRRRIIEAFDAGTSMIDLAAQTGLSYDSVRAILYRAGRTAKGHKRVRQRIAEAVGASP